MKIFDEICFTWPAFVRSMLLGGEFGGRTVTRNGLVSGLSVAIDNHSSSECMAQMGSSLMTFKLRQQLLNQMVIHQSSSLSKSVVQWINCIGYNWG